MKILYKNPGFEHSIDSIMLFQTDNQTLYWSEALLYFYPQVEKQEIAKLNFEEKKKYVSKVLYNVYYKEIKKVINEKVNTYNNHWNLKRILDIILMSRRRKDYSCKNLKRSSR